MAAPWMIFSASERSAESSLADVAEISRRWGDAKSKVYSLVLEMIPVRQLLCEGSLPDAQLTKRKLGPFMSAVVR